MQSTVNNCVLRKVGVTQRRDRGREFEGGKTETNSLDCQNSTSLDHRSQFTQAISQSGRQAENVSYSNFHTHLQKATSKCGTWNFSEVLWFEEAVDCFPHTI